MLWNRASIFVKNTLNFIILHLQTQHVWAEATVFSFSKAIVYCQSDCCSSFKSFWTVHHSGSNPFCQQYLTELFSEFWHLRSGLKWIFQFCNGVYEMWVCWLMISSNCAVASLLKWACIWKWRWKQHETKRSWMGCRASVLKLGWSETMHQERHCYYPVLMYCYPPLSLPEKLKLGK